MSLFTHTRNMTCGASCFYLDLTHLSCPSLLPPTLPAVYRLKFLKTYPEMRHSTPEWKTALGAALFLMGFTGFIVWWQKVYGKSAFILWKDKPSILSLNKDNASGGQTSHVWCRGLCQTFWPVSEKAHNINDGSVPFKYPSEPKPVSQHAQYQSHGSDSSKWTPCFSNISYISVWQVKMSTERKVYYQGIIYFFVNHSVISVSLHWSLCLL